MKNRGRIQAQGEVLEKSEKWSTDQHVNKQSGIDLLTLLKSKLHRNDLKLRESEFAKAEDFIKNAPEIGVSAQVSKTYRVKDTRSERVDIEIIRGISFED
jgi:hypothetical protein